jgi:hypothetical protein
VAIWTGRYRVGARIDFAPGLALPEKLILRVVNLFSPSSFAGAALHSGLETRGGPGCLNRFSASISGISGAMLLARLSNLIFNRKSCNGYLKCRTFVGVSEQPILAFGSNNALFAWTILGW